MRKHHSIGSPHFKPNEFLCVLITGPELGGIFSEYPSNVERNASNELSTSDKDSNS